MTLQDQTRDHSFDGIQEFDNRLPNWWLWTFYGACIFSVFYWVHFHILGSGPLSGQAYLNELAVQEAKLGAMVVTDEDLVEMSKDEAAVGRGKKTFTSVCAACHRADGGGATVGPNLTDKFWLHGGSPTQILNTITNGVPAKGMMSWKSLGVTPTREVAAFVLTLRNTNVADGKAPQGEEYVPEK